VGNADLSLIADRAGNGKKESANSNSNSNSKIAIDQINSKVDLQNLTLSPILESS